MLESRTSDKSSSSKYLPDWLLKYNLRVAISTTVWVLLFLISIELFWKFPKQFFVFISFVFLFWSSIFWVANRKRKEIGRLQILQLMTLWIVTTVSILGGVYKVDKAGWNWFRLTGYDVNLEEEYFDLIDQSADQCRERYGFILKDPEDPAGLIIPKGVHEISETLIIPRDITLTFQPGAELRFGAGCSLVSYGPIHARGTEGDPVIFTAKNRLFKWGVLGVVKAEESVFDYVVFRNARSAHVNDITFPAGLSVIDGDVEITRSRFVGMFGKDAVNVQNGKVLVKHNVFQDSYKDGLDLDGASGEVSFNEFINCDDEGIDLSQNLDVRVFNNKILDRKGGRLSADNNLDEIVAQNTLGFLEK